jgi:hypothetical protein
MPNKMGVLKMNIDQLTALLDDAKSSNNSSDFTIIIDNKDMRSVLTRLRHMRTKGLVTDYQKIDNRTIEITGYQG